MAKPFILTLLAASIAALAMSAGAQAEDVVRFQEILREAGVNTHVRKSRGRDISAACGQLRREQVRAEEEVKFDAGAGVALPVIA